MKLENWKPVAGYEGLYLASDLGRVMNARTGKQLKPVKQSNGYLYFTLYNDGTPTVFRAHRIIAATFCEKPDGCDVVNHLDNDKANNAAANLEWTTQKENIAHADRQGRREDARKKAHAAGWAATSKPVIRIDEKTGGTKYYPSAGATAKDGFNPSSVGMVCRGEMKHSGGYLWRFLNG